MAEFLCYFLSIKALSDIDVQSLELQHNHDERKLVQITQHIENKLKLSDVGIHFKIWNNEISSQVDRNPGNYLNGPTDQQTFVDAFDVLFKVVECHR